MAKFLNLEKIHPHAREILAGYLPGVLDAYNKNVVSIFVYGSAAGKSFVPKHSDINIGIMFDKVDFDMLKKAHTLVKAGAKNKISTPLFLSEEYIRRSLDVFPIEFLEFKENHVLIYGKDVLSGLDVKGEYIRLFCEQQIKGKLVRIRQAYIETGLKNIDAVLKESLNSLLPIFRNLLRLRNKTPLFEKNRLLEQTCELFNLDKEVFLLIFDCKIKNKKIDRSKIETVSEKYLNEIGKLAEVVDES